MEIEQSHDPVMVEAARRAKKWRRVFWVAILWLFAWTALFLWQVIVNTDVRHFLPHILILSTAVSPLMLIWLIPLGMVGHYLGNLKTLRPYRWWISLLLPFALCCWPIVDGMREVAAPSVGFQRYFHQALPASASNVERDVTLLAIGDLTATYSFECSRQDTERLIRALEITPETSSALEIAHAATTGRLMARIPHWTSPRNHRTTLGDSQSHFLEFWTDETFTRVIVRRTDT